MKHVVNTLKLVRGPSFLALPPTQLTYFKPGTEAFCETVSTVISPALRSYDLCGDSNSAIVAWNPP